MQLSVLLLLQVLLILPLLLLVLPMLRLLLQVLPMLRLLLQVLLTLDWQDFHAQSNCESQAVFLLAGAQWLLLGGEEPAAQTQQAVERPLPQARADGRLRAGAPACIQGHMASPLSSCQSPTLWLKATHPRILQRPPSEHKPHWQCNGVKPLHFECCLRVSGLVQIQINKMYRQAER
jgi:hypothetical protein